MRKTRIFLLSAAVAFIVCGAISFMMTRASSPASIDDFDPDRFSPQMAREIVEHYEAHRDDPTRIELDMLLETNKVFASKWARLREIAAVAR